MRPFRVLLVRVLPVACAMALSAPMAATPSNAQQQKTVNTCRDGKAEVRLKACTELIKRGGKDLEAYYYNRSFAWYEKGECDLAMVDADKALSLKRDADNIMRVGVLAQDCRNDYERARAQYDEAIRLFPKNAWAHFNRGVLQSHQADYPKALADINHAISLSPREPDFFYRRGQLWADQEEYDKAIADYSTAIRMKPSMSEAYSYRALAYSGKDDDTKALADHTTAIRLDPGNADRYDNRARFYRRAGDYQKALADHDKAVSLSPISTHYTGRASTWQAKGDIDRALEDSNEAVKREIGTVWALLQRGIIHRYRGDYDRAIADFDALLRRYPFDATTYVERGRAYEKKGDVVRARADFERALKERGSSVKTAHDDARAQLASLDSAVTAAKTPVAPPKIPLAALTVPAAKEPVAAAALPLGRRVALVIGNADYVHVPKLGNPARDAQSVATALRSIGFQTVTVADNLTRETLANALRKFSVESENADWAMVYYAGHGIEIGGVNYLVPVDAKLSADRDAQFEAISLEQVLASVEGAKRIKLVVLDACRDNPFAQQMRRTVATRSIGRGLSRIEPEGATLVVYAAKHGQTALDGTGNNSPFAAALTKRMTAPGLEINKVFRLIRDDVMEATAGRQEPFTYGSLPGREDFFFVAGK